VRHADHLGNFGEAVGDQKGTAADRDQCYVVCPRPVGTSGLCDSPLEEGGFELAVPPRTERPWETQGAHKNGQRYIGPAHIT
jgi:hypothetical protein